MKALPNLLFLHGALGCAQELLPLMEILKEKGFNTLSFDFSGHGKHTPWPNEFRIDLFARDLENYLSTQKLENIVVFGYSMGGYVALYHKVNFENSPISHIFTYGTKFNWSESAVAKELPMLNPDHLKEKFPEFVIKLKAKHGERYKSLLLSTAHMMQNLERLDGLTKEELADIQIPVTLMLGDQDRMVTSEETQLTKDCLHHSQMKTISHSKHDLEKANLKEIGQIISENIYVN